MFDEAFVEDELASRGPEAARPVVFVATDHGFNLGFDPDGKGRANVTRVTVLATPGSTFVFSGNLVSLDSRAGTMIVLDPRNDQTYQIGFNPGSLSSIQNIHSGQHVRVTTTYDGKRYVAETVTAE